MSKIKIDSHGIFYFQVGYNLIFFVVLRTCFFKWRSLWNFSSVASINKILISNYLFLKMNGFKKFRRF